MFFHLANECSVASHAKARRSGIETSFGPGIYVCSASSDAVYLNPINPIGLMVNHDNVIIAKSEPVALWLILFNDWALTGDSEEALNNRATTNAARATQPPGLASPVHLLTFQD